MKLLFATSNPHKVAEANRIGKPFAVSFTQLAQDYPEIRAESVADVAREGAAYVYQRVKKPVMVEDSGLYIAALNGFPGAYSSYVYQKIGNQGILRLMVGIKAREAQFMSAVGYADKEGVRIFEGRVGGSITREPAGEYGFGYDPIFMPHGMESTFASAPAVKDRISHRSRGVEKLCRWLGPKQTS